MHVDEDFLRAICVARLTDLLGETLKTVSGLAELRSLEGDYAAAEALLNARIMEHLDALGEDELVMLKLTLPEQDDFYAEFVRHPNVVRVVALSGGYSREEANERLSRQNGMVASFSRALSEGLKAQQSEEEFDATLDASIQSIFDASST